MRIKAFFSESGSGLAKSGSDLGTAESGSDPGIAELESNTDPGCAKSGSNLHPVPYQGFYNKTVKQGLQRSRKLFET
jgi:hypothetical protein